MGSDHLWLLGWLHSTNQGQGLHQLCSLNLQAALHQGVKEGLVEGLVWGPEGVADQAQIIGLALVLVLMAMMTVSQDQQGGPGGPLGSGQVEG